MKKRELTTEEKATVRKAVGEIATAIFGETAPQNGGPAPNFPKGCEAASETALGDAAAEEIGEPLGVCPEPLNEAQTATAERIGAAIKNAADTIRNLRGKKLREAVEGPHFHPFGDKFLYEVSMPGLPGEPCRSADSDRFGVLQIDSYNPELFNALAKQQYVPKVGSFITLDKTGIVHRVTDFYEGLLEVYNMERGDKFLLRKNGSLRWHVSTVRELVNIFGHDSTVTVCFPNGRELIYEGPQKVCEPAANFTCALSMKMDAEQFAEVKPMLEFRGWNFAETNSKNPDTLLMNYGNCNGRFAFTNITGWRGYNGPIVTEFNVDLLDAAARQTEQGNRPCRPLKKLEFYASEKELAQVLQEKDGTVWIRTTSKQIKKIPTDQFWETWHHATTADLVAAWEPEETEEKETGVKYLQICFSNAQAVVLKLPEDANITCIHTTTTNPVEAE